MANRAGKAKSKRNVSRVEAYPPVVAFVVTQSAQTVRPGCPSIEALQAATRKVVLDANPLEDIANTKKIRALVVRGRWLPRASLDALLAQVGKAASAR